MHSASLSESANQDRWSVPRKSEVLGADLLLPAETIEIRREARAFADRVLKPLAHELNTRVEREDGFRHDVFRAMVDAGLYSIPFPRDVGGRGLHYPTLATLVVVEELAYYSAGIASALYDAQGDAEYRFTLADNLSTFIGANASWRSKTFSQLGSETGPAGTQDDFKISGYALLDLRAGMEFNNYQVQVWGRNVTNRGYWNNVVHIYDTYGRITGQPATYGVSLSVKW